MAAPQTSQQKMGDVAQARKRKRTPAGPAQPKMGAAPLKTQQMNGALRSAIEQERAKLFRAEAVAGCLRVSLNAAFGPDHGEPDFGYVAHVAETMIGDVLEGLDQALLESS